MRTIRRADRALFIVLVLLLVSIAVAACGGSSGGAAATAGPARAPADMGNGLEGAGSGQEAPQPGATAGPGQPEVGAVDDAKIIRTGTLDLEVSDVPGAIHAARDAIRRMGGYVGASQTSKRRRPAVRPGHIPHPGRPLGGRARRAPRNQRRHHECDLRADPVGRRDQPGRRSRRTDPEPAGKRDRPREDRRARDAEPRTSSTSRRRS